jgi:hypothetical protein
MIDKRDFLGLDKEYVNLLTSKSQGDQASDERFNVKTLARFSSFIIDHDWLTDRIIFENMIQSIIVSSYRFQIYRRVRVVAAISNVRQYCFLRLRLILEASGEYMPG